MKACKLSEKPKFKNSVESLVETISKIDNKKDQKYEFIKGLRTLKSQYSSIYSDEEFLESVKEIVDGIVKFIGFYGYNNEKGQLSSLLNYDNYSKDLQIEDPNYIEDTIDMGKSKQEDMDSTEQEKEEKEAIKASFLNQYFPMATDARLAFEQRFKNNLILALFFNDENDNPRVNISNVEMDKSIKTFRKKLFSYLDNYIQKNFSDSNSFLTLGEQSKLLRIKNMLANGKIIVNPIELIKLPSIDLMTDEVLKEKLEMYMAYIALTHFDEMIENAFSDSVLIENKGNYSVDEIKYKINLGNRSATTWSDDSKDVDETQEIGGIIRLFMESLNMYRLNGEMLPIKMTFSDVKSGFGGIMNLFNGYTTDGRFIRDIILDEGIINLKQKLENSGIKKFYKEGWETIWEKYVQGKTFGELLAETKQDPALLTPLLFTILGKNIDLFFNKRYQEKQAVYSIYENIFNLNNDNSLIRRTINSGGINLDNADLYSFITTLFVNIENIPVIEYRKDSDKKINTIELKQNTSNSRLNQQKYKLAAMYNAERAQTFRTFTIDDFEKTKSIKVRIKNTNLILEITQLDTGINTVLKDEVTRKNQTINDSNRTILYQFLSEVLGENINSDFMEIYSAIGGNNDNLLTIVGNILYNYKVGKTIYEQSEKELTKEKYDKELEKYYTKENIPSTMRGFFQPDLIQNKIFPIIKNFALALDIQRGYSGDTVARDGERKQIALKGLSCLSQKYMELVNNYNLKDPKSILKGFSIYDTFENVEFMRDYAGNDAKKQTTKFSISELFYANFLYDFYGGQIIINKDGTRRKLAKNISGENDTKFRIMGPIISDKNKLAKIRFDWRSTVKLPNGQIKAYFELTPDEIYSIQQKEFGSFYQAMFNRIKSDLSKLQKYLPEHKHKTSIVWAHPAIGKTKAITKYKELADILIDWDNEFNLIRDQWIADRTGVVLGTDEFKQKRNEYLIFPLDPEGFEEWKTKHADYVQLLTEQWNRVKDKAKKENKILVASPHILLKLFPKDFGTILNMDSNTFVKRNTRKDRGYSVRNSLLWKESIDSTIKELVKSGDISDSNIFTTDKLLEDILFDNSLNFNDDYESLNMYAKVRGLKVLDILHDALINFQKHTRETGEDDVSIKLTEGLHYIKGRDGQIHNNPSLFHQLFQQGINPGEFKIRTNDKHLSKLNVNTIQESPEESRRRLSFQTISELLQNNITLKVGDRGKTTVLDDAQQAAQWLIKEGVWRINDVVVFAKIKSDTEDDINLKSLNDFKNWKRYKELSDLYKGNLPEKFDIKSPKFELENTLRAINIIYKYNVFRFKQSKNLLIEKYISEESGQTRDIYEVVRETLKSNHPNWKEETIERKTKEEVESLSKEEKIRRKAEYQLEWDINQSIMAEITKGSEESIGYNEYLDYNENYNYILNNLEDNNDNKKVIARLKSQGIDIIINPEIERYYSLNNWLGESYILTSVGSFITHPGDNNATTIYNYEYGSFGQQVKRNVSQTASKHREVQNSLKGIRKNLRIMIIEDEKDSALTFKGDYDEKGIKTHDGGCWYNGTMVDLDNNSLGADAMGQDKKPFLHAIDFRTGCVIIIKDAGFAITNTRIQQSKRFVTLNKKMNHTIKWTDSLRKFGYREDTYFNWLVDFNGDPLDLKSWYVQRNDSKNNKKFFKFYNPEIDNNGIVTIQCQQVHSNGEENGHPFEVKFAYINGQYEAIRLEKRKGREKNNKFFDLDGNELNTTPEFKPVNSNWELWKIFGGEYSAHFNKEHDLTAINDNNSFKMVNYVMNHTGKVIDPKIPNYSQSNVKQILKESQIDIAPTQGAVKNGAANINSVEIFDNDNYEPTYSEVFTDDFGEQLDAEHTAEGGHVSLMTQVVNALGARGYSRRDAEECYEALELLAESCYEEVYDGLEEKRITKDPSAFKVAIINVMLKTLKDVSISDGNILSAFSQGLKSIQKFGNYNQLEGILPVSSPQIYAKLFSKLASALEKTSIRLKFDGGQLVLNPSNRIYQIINGKLAGQVSDEEVTKLQTDAINNPINVPSKIKMGRNYFIINKFGDITPVLVDNIDDFNFVKQAITEGYNVVEAFVDKINVDKNGNVLLSTNKLGRDLATYDAVITEAGTGNTFSFWELDSIKHLFSWDDKNKIFKTPKYRDLTPLESYWNRYMSGENVEQELLQELQKLGIKEINVDMMTNYLYGSYQSMLNTTSKNGVGKYVVINGNRIKIDKLKTEVTPYEAIVPMIYKTTFGLREEDTVGDIIKDKYFFVRRFIENQQKNEVDESQFDIKLKKTSGNHVYIANNDRIIFGEEVTIRSEVFGDALYRVDQYGKKLYQIPAKEEQGKLVPNCKIIKTFNGVEIIQTDDFLTILESETYTSVSFGSLDDNSKNVLLQLEQSSNESAKNKVKQILNTVNSRLKRIIKGLDEKNANYTIITKNKELKEAYERSRNKEFKSIEEIYSDKAGFNTFIYSDLFTVDTANQNDKLKQLAEVLDDKQKLSEFLKENPEFNGIIKFGVEQHTSFMTSLQAIVSRTPAQSHQSFMAMKIVGFDPNITNSIYVNRMQLFLQGSDFDIDKANFLGLKIRNGKLVTWSPYYDLSSIEKSQSSESLPFPTGKVIRINDAMTRVPFDVIEKDYEKFEIIDGFGVRDNNGNLILAHKINDDTWRLETILDPETPNTSTYLLQHAIIRNIGKENNKIISGNSLDPDVFEIDEDGTYKGIKNINADINLYLRSLDLRNTNGKFENIEDLSNLIRTFNSLGEIPSEFEYIKNIIDRHNVFFQGKNGKKDKRKDRNKREALYNFISIKTKNISKDPINLMQGQSGIDVATDAVKKLVKPDGRFNRLSSIPSTSDNKSVLSRMRQLILTLTGKDNVGIVASAMKVFEAMSHYYNKILSEGTPEQQKRLLSKIKILDKKLSLIANCFTKNKDTILDPDVEEAYDNVNNYQDAFIMMSALLSLATDNAKDPTLSKLNATPETIGCYTAGLVLGLNIEEVAELLISDTGILLAEMVQNNVFNPKRNSFKNLSSAIKFLRKPPQIPKNVDLDEALLMFGLIKRLPEQNEKIDYNSIFWQKRKRSRLKQLAMFLLRPDSFEVEKDANKIARRELEDIKSDPAYWGWNSEKEEEYKNSTGKRREKLQKEYDNYKDLLELKESYEAYIENPNSIKGQLASEEVKVMQDLAIKSSDKKTIDNIKLLKNKPGYEDFLKDIFEWINYREIIDNDKITRGENQYSILEQIRKLNSFNEEMGDLRQVLKLNQGLPNSVQDQLSWINSFKNILQKAAERQNKKVNEESDTPLSKFSKYNGGKLDLDLNEFLYNEEYQQLAIAAYDSVKVGVNILDVMLGVPHYRGYMKTMNILYEGGKAVSINYRTQANIAKTILPKFSLNAEQQQKFFKTLNPVIFERVNNYFLYQQQIELKVPQFKIEKGKLIESRDEKGNLQFRTIKLGTKEGNQIFKDYCVQYIFPYLKNNYPDNSFVKAISLRTYGYNLDHQISNNIGKTQSYNMQNPIENVQFNEIKRGLNELNSVRGLIDILFCYNLIAYNGQPGAQALTDLFEDFVIYDTNDTISEYIKYITYLDESDIELFDLNEESEDYEYLCKVLAPTVFPGDNVKGMEYIWVLNPETNKEVLLKREDGSSNENNFEDDYGYEDYNPYDDDNDFDELNDGYSRYQGYTTMEYIKTHWLESKWTEADDTTQIKSKKILPFVLGKELLLNPDVIFSKFREKYKVKFLHELTPQQKNKFLKECSKNINLFINGKNISLNDFIQIAKENGWKEEDIYDGFVFVRRKSRDHVYDTLVYSKLKHRIELLLKPKDNC